MRIKRYFKEQRQITRERRNRQKHIYVASAIRQTSKLNPAFFTVLGKRRVFYLVTKYEKTKGTAT